MRGHEAGWDFMKRQRTTHAKSVQWLVTVFAEVVGGGRRALENPRSQWWSEVSTQERSRGNGATSRGDSEA